MSIKNLEYEEKEKKEESEEIENEKNEIDYEDEVIENEEKEGYTISRYEITSYNTERSIDSLLKWVKSGRIIVPDFQRDYVWDKVKASKLVDTVLLGLPMPNIFLYKDIKSCDTERYLLVDGFQRIQSLMNFRDGNFDPKLNIKTGYNRDEIKNSEFKININSSKWYNKSYLTLTEDEKFNFDEYSINVTVFDQTNPDDRNSMFEVFERINTGSDKLTEQEIRNAIYHGDMLNEIKNVINKEEFIKLVENDKTIFKRQAASELILRIICYYNLYKHNFELNNYSFTTSKKKSLNDFCLMCNENLIQYEDLIKDICKAIDYLSAFDSEVFYGKKRNDDQIGNRVNSVFAEALVIALITNDNEINISSQQFRKEKIELWKTQEFYECFVQQSTTKENIEKRIQLLKKIISGE